MKNFILLVKLQYDGFERNISSTETPHTEPRGVGDLLDKAAVGMTLTFVRGQKSEESDVGDAGDDPLL